MHHKAENEKDKEIAEQILDYSIQRFQKEKLLHLIDQALDQQDKEMFQTLTHQLKQLKEK